MTNRGEHTSTHRATRRNPILDRALPTLAERMAAAGIHPVAFSNGKYLVSRMDLCKLIDPVLRPSFIKQKTPFQTVIIDAGRVFN